MTMNSAILRFGRQLQTGDFPGWVYLILAASLIWVCRFALTKNDTDPEFNTQLLKQDPSSGFRLPAIFGRSGRKPIVLACFSSCSCNYERFASVSQKLGSDCDLRIAVAATEERVAPFRRAFPRLKLMALPELTASVKDLNICFLPRMYLFSSTGKLVWLQTQPDDGIEVTSDCISARIQGIARG